MLTRKLSLLLLVTLVALGSGARADDAEMVKEKLFQAKKAYDAEVQKFRKSVADHLDKREDDARKTGNKKLVDQVKAERERFEKSGELPTTCPQTLLTQMAAARGALDKAYTAAVKEFVKIKEDAAAEATEKEQLKHATEAALLFGKRTSLAVLKPTEVKVWNTFFDKNKTFTVDGSPVPRSILMHPDKNGEGLVSFALAGKATAFRATIGIPTYTNPQYSPASPVTFEVLGDGKSLWKFEPVVKLDDLQPCTVNVAKVQKLTLRVTCKDHGWAHCVWLAPIVAE